MKKCNRCSTQLEVGVNWSLGRQKKCDYICIVCIRDRKKEWKKKNPESKKESDKKYYQKNKKTICNRVRKWTANNLEHVKKYQKEYRPVYRDKNRGKINNHAAKRRAVCKSASIGNFKQELECIYSNCPKNYHVDHIIPLQSEVVCGLHVPWNLQYLPAIENIKKGNRIEGNF